MFFCLTLNNWRLSRHLFREEKAVSEFEWKKKVATVFVPRPTERKSVAQGFFFGGSGRRAVAHTRPAFPQNAYGPVGIPLIRGASGAGQSTPPLKGVIARGERTLGP